MSLDESACGFSDGELAIAIKVINSIAERRALLKHSYLSGFRQALKSINKSDLPKAERFLPEDSKAKQDALVAEICCEMKARKVTERNIIRTQLRD